MPIIQVDNFEVGGINHDKVDRDNAPQQLTDGKNIRFSKGSCNSTGFLQEGAQMSIIPYGIYRWVHVDDVDNVEYVFYYSDTKAFRIQSGVHADITGIMDYAGLPIPTWSGGTFGGLHITTNDSGLDEPRWYDPVAGEMTPIGLPAGLTSRSIRFFKNFAFLLNLTDTSLPAGQQRLPYSVRWSDLTDPGTLPDFELTTPGTFAGERPLIDSPGEVVDGVQLGDEFMVFKEDRTYGFRLSGSTTSPYNAVFVSERRFDRGLLHVGLVKEISGNRLIFVARDNVYVTDG